MKNLTLKLDGEEMLSKEQMKNISGGNPYCDYVLNWQCNNVMNEWNCVYWQCSMNYWDNCDNYTARVYSYYNPQNDYPYNTGAGCTLM